jgi:hypothetical protein
LLLFQQYSSKGICYKVRFHKAHLKGQTGTTQPQELFGFSILGLFLLHTKTLANSGSGSLKEIGDCSCREFYSQRNTVFSEDASVRKKKLFPILGCSYQ